jgi:hypothetical protein
MCFTARSRASPTEPSCSNHPGFPALAGGLTTLDTSLAVIAVSGFSDLAFSAMTFCHSETTAFSAFSGCRSVTKSLSQLSK